MFSFGRRRADYLAFTGSSVVARLVQIEMKASLLGLSNRRSATHFGMSCTAMYGFRMF